MVIRKTMEDYAMRENSEHGYSRGMAFKEMNNMNTPWREVLHLGKRVVWSKGHCVQFGRALYVLERGKGRLTHQTLEGVEKILWYIRGGCLFGETPFFDPMPAESYFSCVTDCIAYEFTQEALKEINTARPDLIINLLESMSRKLRILSNQASSLYLDNVLVRTCKFLAQRLQPGSDPLKAELGMSRQEMASLLGVHRISLYKVLRQQEENGMFGPFTRDNITILQPEVFFKLVES